MPRPVALVSASEARHHDSDLPFLVRALGDRGIVADIVDWDAPVDWARYQVAIIRSTWDYHRRLDEFMEWVDRVSTITTLLNPPEVIRWNTDKRYLGELAEAKIAVIPTTYVSSDVELDEAKFNGLLDGDVVVKPTVSAGSNDTERHQSSPETASRHIAALVAARKVAMVQPYQRFIDDNGETGMLFFNGEYSHAFRKGAILATGDNVKNGLFVEEDIGTREPNDQERALGEKILRYVTRKFGEAPLYARVDVVRGSAGTPVLMELEMTEPSLFVHVSPGSAERFAAAVVARR